jgi:FkbM family methyltransferase
MTMDIPLVSTLKYMRRKRRDLAALTTWTHKDEERRTFYEMFIRQPDIVFDVGANVGNRAKIFSRLASRVILFEPQPYCQQVLEVGFAGDKKIVLVPKALGRDIGTARIMVSDAHTVSSMSRTWIDAVKKSGRFSHIRWDRDVEVHVTTLDSAIAEFGMPSFIKIDVEGYEAEVLAGLSRPIAAMSLEFTPEHLESIRNCLIKLNRLGCYEYNLSLGESMQLARDSWVSAEEILKNLSCFDQNSFGDVYARRVSN